MSNGKSPFSEPNDKMLRRDHQLRQAVINRIIKDPLEISKPENMSNVCWDLINAMLNPAAAKRPKARDIQLHPFFLEGIPDTWEAERQELLEAGRAYDQQVKAEIRGISRERPVPLPLWEPAAKCLYDVWETETVSYAPDQVLNGIIVPESTSEGPSCSDDQASCTSMSCTDDVDFCPGVRT